MRNQEDQELSLSVQENILKAAEAVFAQKGYAGTRISEIAKKGQVNQALIHYYYENKEKLYQAVLAPLIDKWQKYVQSTQWVGDNPRQIIRQFIYTHCAYHFRYPSLYKLAKWEELEGKDLFDMPFFNQDVREKVAALIKWQKNGQLSPNINPGTLQYMIWGMIQQFYSRSPDQLASLLGKEGEPEQLQREIAEQIAEIVLNGIFSQPGGQQKAEKSEQIPVSVWIPPLEREEWQATGVAIWEQLSKYPNLKLTRLADFRELTNVGIQTRGIVLLVHSEYGEMPQWLAEMLREWTANPAAIIGICAAVWVAGGSRTSDMQLQRMIEEHINRLGGYTFSRIEDQHEHDYIKRFHALVSAMSGKA